MSTLFQQRLTVVTLIDRIHSKLRDVMADIEALDRENKKLQILENIHNDMEREDG